MKGFLKFLATVVVSVGLSLMIALYVLRSGQLELKAKRIDVLTQKSSVCIDDYGVTVECEDGGMMQLRPGLVVDPHSPLAQFAGDTTSGTFSLQDRTRRHGIEIGIKDAQPFMQLMQDGKVQRHSY